MDNSTYCPTGVVHPPTRRIPVGMCVRTAVSRKSTRNEMKKNHHGEGQHECERTTPLHPFGNISRRVDCWLGHGVADRVGDARNRETAETRAWEEVDNAAGAIVLSRLLGSFYETISHKREWY